MITAFSLIRRRAGIDTVQFQQHWVDPHGVLVCQFPGLQRYSQNRILASDALSLAAQGLQLDGIAELTYETDADQAAATGSPAMAACDVDSPLFIGAVVRVITEAQEIVPPPWDPATPKLMALFPPGVPGGLDGLEGVIGHIENTTIRQRGPKSAMPVLDFPVGHITELWFDSSAALTAAADALGMSLHEGVALFAVDELRLV